MNLISYLDPRIYGGGGETIVRELLDEAIRRGHRIRRSSVRWGRVSKLIGPRVRTFDDPDLWLIVDPWNCPQEGRGFPPGLMARARESGRYVTLENAWTSACVRPHLPCGADAALCPDPCGHQRAGDLFAGARVATFLSPMHRRATEALVGRALPNAFELPPTLDRNLYRSEGAERDIPYLYVGTIAEYKGALEVEERFGDQGLVWAGHNLMGRPLKGRHLGFLRPRQLARLYRRALRFVHLPRWIEPMGRTVIEAALSGCELIVNERVGATGWGRTEAEFRALPHGAGSFWDRVEGLV